MFFYENLEGYVRTQDDLELVSEIRENITLHVLFLDFINIDESSSYIFPGQNVIIK